MKRNVLLFVLTLITVQLSSQEKIKGNGDVTIVKTDLNSFNKLELNEDFKVLLIKSDVSSVEVETDENLHEVIQFKVIDSVLTFQKTKKIRSKKRLNITVFYTNALTEIKLKNDAEIEALKTIALNNLILKIDDYGIADLTIKSNQFKLINNNKSRIQLRSKTKLTVDSPNVSLLLNKSSNTFINVKTDSLKINTNERSRIQIEGFASILNASINESSNLDGKDLEVKETTLSLNGTSTFSIHTIEKISIDAKDKSKIELYGEPQILIAKFSNFTKLHKKELSENN